MMRRLANLAKRWVVAFVLPRPLIGAYYVPRYIRHWFNYRRKATAGKPGLLDSYPCLTDWTPYTPFDPHYFFQGAWLARRIRDHHPELHVDMGSSVLTVGMVSAQVETVFVDYRPIRAALNGMTSVAGNITSLPFGSNMLHSVSCLHVIEHIGLGRYGDPVDPEGSVKAGHELSRVLAGGGLLYLSVPVGQERVEFNAHRVFAPQNIVKLFNELELVEFSYVSDVGTLQERRQLQEAMNSRYACGLYVFRKPAASVAD